MSTWKQGMHPRGKEREREREDWMKAHGGSIQAAYFWAYKYLRPVHYNSTSANFTCSLLCFSAPLCSSCFYLSLCFLSLQILSNSPFSVKRYYIYHWVVIFVGFDKESFKLRVTMENKKQVAAGGSSSSRTFDNLFGPKVSSSASSSSPTTGLFGSIFPPPSAVPAGRDSHYNQGGSGKYGNPDSITQSSKSESSGISTKENGPINYQHEPMEPCNFSSSIYYGGQENYSPRTRSTESHHILKKDGEENDPNGSNPNSASRGNWWQGSLYYWNLATSTKEFTTVHRGGDAMISTLICTTEIRW